jgi:hypothetical protein
MSLSELTLEETLELLNGWIIDGWLVRVILVAPPGVELNSRGILRWRTDNMLEVAWQMGSPLDGSVVFPVNEAVRFRPREPGPVSSAYPEFADIGGGEARYSDCLELSFSFGILLLLRFDMSMFDPPDPS